MQRKFLAKTERCKENILCVENLYHISNISSFKAKPNNLKKPIKNFATLLPIVIGIARLIQQLHTFI
ncbi:hypothetical protein B0A79_09390 [Flavobacterium piscis]|uniref:Uncharacterized protein n=1 Tax=Flavobacterium piscis TaxID=1114874 RepID=A0ABX2XJK1_9FLAO|nr:hypothetical protein FLP_09920 [Flavobacterium piscis]OXG05275.1 hypothetical protein B0A79_09390 [Flavobacterium piscis]